MAGPPGGGTRRGAAGRAAAPDRGFTVTTPAGTDETRYARNTYSWDPFDQYEFTVILNAGTNTITFSNPGGYAPNIDQITVAPTNLP
jgi:hypothetical protein